MSALITKMSLVSLGLEPGRSVVASVKASSIHIIRRQT